jgi:hypothetical protein
MLHTDISDVQLQSDPVRWVPCHHGMARPQVADGGDALQVWRVAANIYRPSDRRLSAKLVPTFADKGCRVVSATDPPPAVNSVFLTG